MTMTTQQSSSDASAASSLLTVSVREQYDLVSVRGRARRLADLLKFDSGQRTRMSTAVSEVTRYLLRQAEGGEIRMSVTRRDPAYLCIEAVGRSGAQVDPSCEVIRTARRLMDHLQIVGDSAGPARIVMAIRLPGRAPSNDELLALIRELSDAPGSDPFADILQQNRELVQAQSKLAELNRQLRETQNAKDRFIALLGHELRNQVNGIRNSLEAFERSSEGIVRERMRKLTWAQVQNLAQLADDLMDSTRVVRGDLSVHPETLELSRYLAFCGETWSDKVREAGLDWRYEEPGGDLWVKADPSRLAQIIANLVSNACKFTDPGGSIVLTARSETDRVWIEVRDTGCGIAPEHLDRVLEPFSQTEDAKRRMTGGLGLGLSIVRGLVVAQDGTMEILSRPDERPGTTVRFSLPATSPPADANMPTVGVDLRLFEGGDDRPTAPRKERILLIDDHAASAEALEILLEMEGFEVHLAATGSAAMQCVAEQSFDVVLCDLGLPEMDGFEVAMTLSERLGDDCPLLVAMSGFTDETTRKRIEASGFDRFFPKPVDTTALRSYLDGTGATESNRKAD